MDVDNIVQMHFKVIFDFHKGYIALNNIIAIANNKGGNPIINFKLHK